MRDQEFAPFGRGYIQPWVGSGVFLSDGSARRLPISEASSCRRFVRNVYHDIFHFIETLYAKFH